MDLEPIKKRLAVATPGPWEVYDSGVFGESFGIDAAGGGSPVLYHHDETEGGIPDRENADLIAHAPADLAALVSEVERLRARTTQLEARLRTEDDQFWELQRALRELVDLKDYKDEHGKTEEYERRQPEAWKRARVLLFV